jgi:hypothetical protein
MAAAIGSIAAPTQAYQVVQRFSQAQVGPDTAPQVEASIIDVVACNGPGENGAQFYLYQYQKRPGFRAVFPPYWGQGANFSDYYQAASTTCGLGM